MTTVLLALDNAPEALIAARRANALFGTEATYLAVNVADAQADWTETPTRWGGVYPYPAASGQPGVEELPRSSDQARDDARATARAVSQEAGVAAAPVGEVGDPVSAILTAAHDHRADVIVVGVTDKSWWRRLLDTSVSKALVRESPIPVLVVGAATQSP